MNRSLLQENLRHGIVKNSMYMPTGVSNTVAPADISDYQLSMPSSNELDRPLKNRPFDREGYLKEVESGCWDDNKIRSSIEIS